MPLQLVAYSTSAVFSGGRSIASPVSGSLECSFSGMTSFGGESGGMSNNCVS